MTRGDDERLLCRSIRQLSKQYGEAVPIQLLKKESGLADVNWDSALALAIELKHLVQIDENTLKEGKLMANQPDPEDFPKTPFFHFAPGKQPLWERIWLAALATLLICFVIFLIYSKTEFSEQTWKLARVLASILAATVGGFLSGMLEVRGERPGLSVRATGALGAFVLVFFAL